MKDRDRGLQSRYYRKLLITATFWVVALKKSYCKVKSLLVIQENSYQLQVMKKYCKEKNIMRARWCNFFLSHMIRTYKIKRGKWY